MDVADPTSPVIIQTVDTLSEYSDVTVFGAHAYVTRLEVGGLEVWDISDPSSPDFLAHPVGGVLTTGVARGMAVTESYVYVTGGGLEIFPIQCPAAVPAHAVVAAPRTLGRAPRPGLHLAIPAPNPFGTKTILSFSLPARRHAQLALYDVAGRRVQRLVDRMLAQGDHSVTWDARDQAGRRVAPGTYFVRLTAGDVTRTRKVVFLGGQ